MTAQPPSSTRPKSGRRRVLLRAAALPVVVVLLAIAVTASTGGGRHYRVRSGDTLSEIAARFHTSVAALVRLNKLPGSGDLIYAGSTLRLPGRAHHHRHHPRHHRHHGHHGHGGTVTYVVRSGDFLYGIAARFHADPQKIAARNHLPASRIVVIGQKLRIHVHHAVRPRHGFHGFRVPSRASVARMIRATASRWRIDGRFALGISYEEAGFNQRMISAVGAVGAMQVMPRTGWWVSTNVVRRPLNIYRAKDNITAGVALLSVLLRETGGNMRLAAAGYYQGLASVRQRGMYNDTKRYVANVLALRNRF
jgi:N-acetylmuramoyl-L-alanine amidase